MSSVLSYDVTTRCLSLLFRSVASIICLLEYSFILFFTFCFTVFARHFTISSSFIWYFASSFCILVFHGSDFLVVFWLPSFLFDFSMYIICLSFIMSVAVGIFVSRLISSWDVVGGVSSILFIMLLWVVSKFPSSFSVGIKAISALYRSRRTFKYINEESFKILYNTYIRPNLEFCIPAWCPYLSKDIEVMEKVQRRATKMVPGLKNLQYEDRLQRLGILNLSARRLRGDLIETFKIMNSLTNVPYQRFFEKSTYHR